MVFQNEALQTQILHAVGLIFVPLNFFKIGIGQLIALGLSQ